MRPSLEPIPITPEGYIRIPPKLPSTPPASPARKDDIRARLSALSKDELLDHAVSCERRLEQWKQASTDLVSSLALSPDMTETLYARSLRELLSDSLVTLEAIDELRHVECSMPCVASERPRVDLIRWGGLHFSEWRVEWAPASWWVSVSAVGNRWGLGFNCLTNVSSIQLSGRLRCAFADDLTSVRISFSENPGMHMTIESVVGWGAVPIPVRESIEEMVREEIESFVQKRLTGNESIVVVLRRKALMKLNEGDLLEAKLQAERAGSINLRSPTL